MGLLGTSAQAFTDNFLKTYMAIGEDRRAEASQKIAQQMAKAKLDEIATEQKMRAELAAREQGLMSPVMGDLQQPIPQAMPKFGFLGGQSLQADQTLLNQPTRQVYDNQYKAWEAQGKDPLRESLLGQADIVAKYFPEKAMPIKASLANTEERVQAQREIAAARNQAMMEGIKDRLAGAIEQLKMKGDFASELQAKALDVQRLKIENALKNKSEGKKTDTDDAYESYKAEKKKQGVPDSKVWPRYKFDIWYKQQTQKPSAAESILGGGGRTPMQWNPATGKFE